MALAESSNKSKEFKDQQSYHVDVSYNEPVQNLVEELKDLKPHLEPHPLNDVWAMAIVLINFVKSCPTDLSRELLPRLERIRNTTRENRRRAQEYLEDFEKLFQEKFEYFFEKKSIAASRTTKKCQN